MTTYARRGHWRTSVHGTRHWVSGHEVNRDDWANNWSHGGSPSASWAPDEVRSAFVSGRWPTAFLASKNSKCPVCGTPVYFYRNEHGSRVYFDELGPPWPKHPCTDRGRDRYEIVERHEAPSIHRPESGMLYAYLASSFEASEGIRLWSPHIVHSLSPTGDFVVAILVPLYSSGAPVALVDIAGRGLEVGALVFRRDAEVSFLGQDLEVRTSRLFIVPGAALAGASTA